MSTPVYKIVQARIKRTTQSSGGSSQEESAKSEVVRLTTFLGDCTAFGREGPLLMLSRR